MNATMKTTRSSKMATFFGAVALAAQSAIAGAPSDVSDAAGIAPITQAASLPATRPAQPANDNNAAVPQTPNDDRTAQQLDAETASILHEMAQHLPDRKAEFEASVSRLVNDSAPEVRPMVFKPSPGTAPSWPPAAAPTVKQLTTTPAPAPIAPTSPHPSTALLASTENRRRAKPRSLWRPRSRRCHSLNPSFGRFPISWIRTSAPKAPWPVGCTIC